MAGKDGDRTQQLFELNPRVHCSLTLFSFIQCFTPYYTALNILIKCNKGLFINAGLFAGFC